MKTTTKVKNNQTNWYKYFRPRVGDVVVYQGNYFQNTSGRNDGEPQIGPQKDWIYIGTYQTVKQSQLMIVSKKPGNIGNEIEPGDLVCGMLDDNTTCIAFGRYMGDINGNALQNVNNYECNPINF